MSEIEREFIRIKDEILDVSKYILEHLNEFNNFNFVKFNQDILTIQSKLSTLGSLSKSGPKDLDKYKNQVKDIFIRAIEAQRENERGNQLEYAFKMGSLNALTMLYLNEINSVLMRI